MKTTHTKPPYRWLALTAGVVAISALAGAAALATGLIDMGPAITARFPFHSAVFAGLALAVVVGLPMTLTAYLASAGHPRAPGIAMAAGVLLMGWVAVQPLIIQTFSWLQPAMAVAGALVFLGGWLHRSRTERGTR